MPAGASRTTRWRRSTPKRRRSRSRRRWSVWAAGFGGSQTTAGNAATGSNNSASSIYGTAVGADYSLSPNTIAGFSLAGGGTNFSVTNGGSGRSDLFQAGAFVRHTAGAAYVSAALAYGWQDVTTNRTVTIAGLDRCRPASTPTPIRDAWRVAIASLRRLREASASRPMRRHSSRPSNCRPMPKARRREAGAFALAYGAKNANDTRSELGLRTDKSYALNDAILNLRGRLAWAHDFDPDRSIATTFQALPTASIRRQWCCAGFRPRR